MKRALRCAAVAVVVGALGLTAFVPQTWAAAPQEQIASIQQLESQALAQASIGRFDQSAQLLNKAASINHDPDVVSLLNQNKNFNAQLDQCDADRNKQFKDLVSQAKLLVEKQKPDFALEIAAGAFSLAKDPRESASKQPTKESFRKEPWVDQLVSASISRAQQYERNEQWLKALRIYKDLSILEPAIPSWKDKLKTVTRHVRLLAMYTPDALTALQDSEVGEREAVDQLLHPTTQPSSKSNQNEKAVNDTFKIDWHEQLRGVQQEMLSEALVDADTNYYRGITYKDLLLGGISGLRAVVMTEGLDKAFSGLADAGRKKQFLEALDKAAGETENAALPVAASTVRQTLFNLRQANDSTVKLPREVFVSEFADGAFERLDPFTSMIWPSDVEEFNKATQGKFSGVGVQIQSDDDGSLRVVTPLEDTPAYKAGIKAGDVIAQIDGKSAKHISVNQAVRTITGPPGTHVKLTVRSPNGKEKDYLLKRETIHVASVKGYIHKPGGGWEYMVDPNSKIGYIRITNFTSDTSAELNSALETMKVQHARALIMDLRYNPGGLLTAATDVADKFLDHGLIVSTKPDRDTGNQETRAFAKPDPDDCNLPLVVLVNQYSASASEIVSGALKDDGRGVIVGERTFGKGSVQMLFPLTDHSAYLKLTTSHYYLPSGRCIHREENSKDWGVDPDVNVELTPDQMRAAIDAREELDVLRDAVPAGGEQPKLQEKAKDAAGKGKSAEKRDLLAADPQMSAAVLLLRLRLANAQS